MHRCLGAGASQQGFEEHSRTQHSQRASAHVQAKRDVQASTCSSLCSTASSRTRVWVADGDKQSSEFFCMLQQFQTLAGKL